MSTEYQDEIDHERIAALRRYRAVPSSMPIETVRSNVNINFFHAYGPDFTTKTAAHLTIDPVSEYDRLLRGLNKVPGLRIDTFRHYHPERKLAEGELACVVRHDLDGDLVTARILAEVEQRNNARTTYYLLHTAPYYGLLNADGVFERNEVSAQIYREIEQHGHELALHTDGMTLYQYNNVDGAEAIVAEIDWLRSQGFTINGTTAHNSFPIYGCENYAIFKGKTRGKFAGKKGVFHNGRWAPMQVLDEKEMGLDYEANELLWQTDTRVFYCALRSQNVWRTDILNFTREELNAPRSFGRFADYRNRFVTSDDILDLVREVPAPAYIYIVVHPMHYGLRTALNQAPWLADAPTDGMMDGSRVWAIADPDGSIRSSAITRTNEFGVPDRNLKTWETGDFRVAVFGGRQILTHTVSADSKYGQYATLFMRPVLKKPRATALGFVPKDACVDDMESALRRISAVAEPDACVVAFDPQMPDIEDRVGFANRLAESGRPVFAVLEGRFDAESLTALSGRVRATIVDPHPLFGAYRGSSELLWPATSIWTPQAHAIAARALATAINSAFAPVS
ncbi:MAG: hypothetical protein WAT70_00035 [Rhizobiaceae bacterium]